MTGPVTGPVTGPAAGRRGRTREAVLAAYVELIEELGTDDIPYRLVARRSGTSERTVYRTFPTRVDLLRATADRVRARTAGRSAPASVFDLPLDVRESMHAHHRQPELAHVVAEAAVRDEEATGAREQVEHVTRLVDEELPRLGEQERLSLAVALTQVDSAATWVTLRRELDMDGRDIADAAAWASEVVLQPARLRTGDG